MRYTISARLITDIKTFRRVFAAASMADFAAGEQARIGKQIPDAGVCVGNGSYH